MSLILKSNAFDEGGAIPALYTCEGKNISPPLEWHGAPAGTLGFALIVDDPDAPDPGAPQMTWVHWLLFNIPPEVSILREDISRKALPHGAGEGINDWKKIGYGGPCPPVGKHRYFFKLYALNTILQGIKHPTKSKLLAAMKGHVIAQTELVGTYKKSGH